MPTAVDGPKEGMTRSDLVGQLAEKFDKLTHRDTEFAVKTIVDAMSDALARGHRIEMLEQFIQHVQSRRDTQFSTQGEVVARLG